MIGHCKSRVVLSVFAACLAWNTTALAYGQEKPAAPPQATYVAEMKISIVKGKALTENNGPTEDIVGTLSELLMNRSLIQEGVKAGKLGELKSLAGGDPATKILAGLSVLRDSAAPESVLVLIYRGSDAGDCLEILSALAKAQRELVKQLYSDASDDSARFVSQASKALQKKLDVAEKEYAEFRQTSLPTEESDVRKATILALGQKKSAMLVHRLELETRLKWVEKAAAGDQRTAALLKAAEWAARSGYERLPKEVRDKTDPLQAYIAALKGELDENNMMAKAMDRLLEEKKVEAKHLHELDLKESYFRKNIERLDQLYNATLRRSNEIAIRRAGPPPFEIRVMAPVAVRKLP